MSFLPIDVIQSIILYLPIEEIQNAFTSRDLQCLKSDRHYLHRIAVENTVPDGTIYEMIAYSKLNLDDKLAKAAANGDMESVQRILNAGSKNYQLAVNNAALHGYTAIVEYMLELSNRDLIEGIHIPGLINGQELLNNAALGGYMECVELALSLKPYRIDIAQGYAAMGGHEDIFDYLVTIEPISDVNSLLTDAAKGGHIHMIQKILRLGGRNINFALSSALKRKHLEAAEYLIAKGAGYSGVSLTFESAVESGSIDMVERLFTKDQQHLGQGLRFAAYNGDLNMVKYLVKNGAGKYNEAAKHAAYGGHEAIVKYFLDLEVNNYNELMVAASVSGNMSLVKLLLELGANDYNGAMLQAAGYGNKSIVELMLSLGADNFNQALVRAAKNGCTDIVKRMVELGATKIKKAIEEASGLKICHIEYTHKNADTVEFLKQYL